MTWTALLRLALALQAVHVGYGKELWMSALVDEGQMESTGGKMEVLPTPSSMLCIAAAMAIKWSSAVCFAEERVGRECRIYNGGAVHSAKGKKSGTAGTTPCKIRQSYGTCEKSDKSKAELDDVFDDGKGAMKKCTVDGPVFEGCAKSDGSMAKLDEILVVDSENFQKCSEEGLVATVPEKKTKCEAPFDKAKGNNCLYVLPDQLSWGLARAHCIAAGGDLFAPDSKNDMKLITEDLAKNDNPEALWVAAKKEGGEWKWLPDDEVVTDWAEGEPDGESAGHECAAMTREKDYLLVDADCDDTEYQALCEARV